MKILQFIKKEMKKLLYLTRDKHNTIKMRYLSANRWVDEDKKLIHAMFEVLCQFVENERKNKSFWNSRRNSTAEMRSVWIELNVLYDWWISRQNADKYNPIFSKNVKPPQQQLVETTKRFINPLTLKTEIVKQPIFKHATRADEIKWEKAWRESIRFEKNLDIEEEEMAIRLIKIRHYMWS